MNSIDQRGTKIATLVDALGQINGISLNSINLNIKDKSSLQEGARSKAYEDAYQKAKDYAELAGLSVGEALIIEDQIKV